jgi:hypothetical protein
MTNPLPTPIPNPQPTTNNQPPTPNRTGEGKARNGRRPYTSQREFWPLPSMPRWRVVRLA